MLRHESFFSFSQFTPYLPTEDKLDVESYPGLGKVKLNYIRDHKVQKDLSILLFFRGFCLSIEEASVSWLVVSEKRIKHYNKMNLYLHLFVVFADRRVVEAVIIGHHHLVL